MHPHITFFDLSELTVLEVWRAAQLSGFSLHWNPARRCVVMRPLEVAS